VPLSSFIEGIIHPGQLFQERGCATVSDKTQRRLLTVLALAMNFGMNCTFTHLFIDVPEHRGIKDDLKEAALKGAARSVSVVVASIVVREVVKSRR
jgi:hypothetical protein